VASDISSDIALENAAKSGERLPTRKEGYEPSGTIRKSWRELANTCKQVQTDSEDSLPPSHLSRAIVGVSSGNPQE
jgi:hypothetical protein